MENDELEQFLESIAREDQYRVDAVLKESASETTQRVYLVNPDGSERGPLIRKFIAKEAGFGTAYERICEAQQNGKRFSHIPGILELYDRGDMLVVVMELVPGETLKDYLYRLDPSPELANDLFPQLCDAVIELHEEFDPPIIHRDLKPTNIMVARQNLTIIDFGIAREFKPGAESDTTHFGTRAFAPPEQFGFGQTTVRSDIYALGMLLYFCLTEQIPDPDAHDECLNDERIPSNMAAVIHKATQFDPANRYASVREMKDAFFGAPDASAPEAIAQPATERAGEHNRIAPVPIAIDETPFNSHPASSSIVDNGQQIPASQPRPAQRAESPAPVPVPVSVPEQPHSSQQPKTSEPEPRSLPKTVWNALLGLFWAVELYACILLLFNPPASMSGYPPITNTIGYGILMPVFFTATCWLFMFKKPIIRRFPKLEYFTGKRYFIIYAFVIFGIFTVLGVLGFYGRLTG